MVSLGQVLDRVVRSAPLPGGQILDRAFVERKMEEYGFLRSVAGPDDFDRAVDALCVSAASSRGILVTGVNGCGKSCFLGAVWRLMACPARIRISCADETRLGWLNEDEDDLHGDHVFLDDFGAERFLYGDYDRVGTFICRWYDRHNFNRYLYVSTNLTGTEIDARYGGRVFDRLRELCVILPMSGASKRKEIIIQTKGGSGT